MNSVEMIFAALASSDPSIRHEAALRVIDHNVEAAAPVLLAAALNPENRGFTGTLIYALGHFDCASYFAQLIQIAVSQGYEAAAGAINIIENQGLTPDQNQLDEAHDIMKRALSGDLTTDQAEALRLIGSRYYDDEFA